MKPDETSFSVSSVTKCDMERSVEARVNNVKAHLVLKNEGKLKLQEILNKKEVKTYGNYKVLRDVHTYIIFPSNGFVNITGIKSLQDLPFRVIELFCSTFSVSKEEIGELVVDNITAVGNFNRRVNLEKLQQVANVKSAHRSYFTVHFDRHIFPGAFCKTFGFGTLSVYASGKYVVVGAKCQDLVQKLVEKVFALIKTL
jgi:TATA-box binding protein (TBP) (component of TFIID and TFIIIB)